MKIVKTIFSFFILTAFLMVGCSSDDDVILEPSSGFLMGKLITEATVGEDVQFNSSAANADAYHWDFGDGTKSEEKNPVKPYFDSGVYTVTLTVENKDGTDSFSQEITVLPFVDFKVENAGDLSTESEVMFTNLSKGADAYEWNFGDEDESVSEDENPSFNYTEDGVYTVTLTAVGAGGSKSISKRVVIGDGAGEGGDDSGGEVETPREVFYIDFGDDVIGKIKMPGGTSSQVADLSGQSGVGIQYDPEENKIYFTDFTVADEGKIWRMSEDGSDMEVLVDGIVEPYGLALNLAERKMYWIDDDGHVSMANMDGSGVVTDFITIEDAIMRGLDYDSQNDKIYFYEANAEIIYVADSNGGNVKPVMEGTYGYSLHVDEKDGKIYYHDYRADEIVRMNLDGSNPETIAETYERVFGIAVDSDNGKVYWSERRTGEINRVDLDGSNRQTIVSGLGSPRGIFIK